MGGKWKTLGKFKVADFEPFWGLGFKMDSISYKRDV